MNTTPVHSCPSYPCPICHPHLMPSYTLPPAPQFQPVPQGCVCPPTSEQTCQSPTCPRKDHRTLGQKVNAANTVGQSCRPCAGLE